MPGFDRADAVLLLQLVLGGGVITAGLLWLAAALGMAWRVMLVMAGG